MATLLADSPTPPANGQAPPEAPSGDPAEPAPASSQRDEEQRACGKCGTSMAAEQDWCVHCGAGAPGSLGAPSWRSATAILGATAILVLLAAAAAYAALSKGPSKARVVTTTVAQAAPPAAATPVNPGAATTTPTTPSAGATSKAKPVRPLGTIKPPKIPLTAITPKASPKVTAPSGSSGTTPAGSQGTSGTPSSPNTTSGGGETAAGEETAPAAILLDTNAASTYNPYAYPAGYFGDPSLAIDGDHSTGWTAVVDPASAPKMAEGLLIDLKDRQKLSAAEVITTTPGMTVQVYGAKGATAPTSITAPAWIALSRSEVAKKKHLRIKLRDSKQAFTFVTLWISAAPAASVGTPQAPGHVTVNELELFPAG
jgi:hypothetical protein